MNRDDPRAQILLSGSHDWVSLAEAQHILRQAGPPSHASEVRLRTLAVVRDLLRSNLVEAGEIAEGFTIWPGDADEITGRIASLWSDTDDDLWPGQICWLANTRTGNDVAAQIDSTG